MSAATLLDSQARRLLSWLTELADIGEPCPVNAAINRRVGTTGNSGAAVLLRQLADAGLITVEWLLNKRVVSIVATGKSTARPKLAEPHDVPRPIPPVRTAEAMKAARARPGDRIEEIRAIVERQKAAAVPPPLEMAPAASVALSAPPPPDPEPVEQVAPAREFAATIHQPEDSSMPIDPVPAPTGPAPAPLNPFTASVEIEDGQAMLVLYLSLDPGPTRAFRQFMRVPLDEMHLLELLGTSALSLRELREATA